MAYAADDLTPLLARPTEQGGGLDFGQGVITSYDPLTASNTVAYRGATLTDLPVLNGSEAVLLTRGAVVGILRSGRSYFILGRITVPNTPEAATALNMVRIHSAHVANNEDVTSESFGDLATPGPIVDDVLVAKSGRALLFMSANMRVVTNGGIDTAGIDMSVQVSGATSVLPGVVDELQSQMSTTQSTANIIAGRNRATAHAVLEGLNPGLHRFTAKYKTTFTGHTTQVSQRTLTVIPF